MKCTVRVCQKLSVNGNSTWFTPLAHATTVRLTNRSTHALRIMPGTGESSASFRRGVCSYLSLSCPSKNEGLVFLGVVWTRGV